MLKLKINITIEQFWNMTPAEMYLLTKTQSNVLEEENKLKAITSYNISAMVALFVNLGLNGKKIPDINEIYPDLFSQEDVSKQLMEAYRILFEAFAILHNNLRLLKGLTNDT